MIFEGKKEGGGHDESNSVEADRVPKYVMEFQIRDTKQLKTSFEVALNAIQFLVWYKTFVSAQNIL